MILKKVFKKTRIFSSLAIPHMLVLPPPPPPPSTISQTCELLGSQCTTVWKSVFYKISRLFAESYLCNETSDSKIKYSLETPFLSRFFIFCDFLNLNQDFRPILQCKVADFVKNSFLSNFEVSYLGNETSDRQKKNSFKTPFLSHFFIFYYFLNLN